MMLCAKIAIDLRHIFRVQRERAFFSRPKLQKAKYFMVSFCLSLNLCFVVLV